jgi:hypothetical protein
MSERRRGNRRIIAFVGAAVVAAAIAVTVAYRSGMIGAPNGPSANSVANVAITADSPLSVLNEGLRQKDSRALAAIFERLTPRPGQPTKPVSDEEAAEYTETLTALRAAFMKLDAPSRGGVAIATSRILEKYSVEPAPGAWVKALPLVHDIFSASLTDASADTRFATLGEISKFWNWMPGRSLTPIEEQALAEWKGKFLPLVVRCLARDDVRTRMAAVACLGTLPIDSAAASAIPYLENDPSPVVRKQTLISFAHRGLLMTDDMVLKRIHDTDPSIGETAKIVLKTRGLTQEQISLGGLIFSPRPDQRVSVIPLVRNRTDLDPVLWLIQLSQDPVETVRISAIEALAQHKTPAAQRRLAEMARSDKSEVVRREAGKFIPSIEETTASLPPLPGSSVLNPKAN